jgi:cation transport ATPase
MFTLIGLGVGAAYLYSLTAVLFPKLFPESFRDTMTGGVGLYFEAASVIVTLVLLRQVLEMKARGQTSSAIKALLGLAPKIAKIVRADGTEEDVPLDSIHVGDKLRVRPGDKNPVNAKVLSGSSFVADRTNCDECSKIKGTDSEISGSGYSYFVPAVIVAVVFTFVIWVYIGSDPKLAHAREHPLVMDPIKETTISAIESLRKSGITVIMITGDSVKTAETVAKKVGLDGFFADVLPQGMAGDGINDALALAQAQLGIAMRTGADIAMISAAQKIVVQTLFAFMSKLFQIAKWI